MSILAIDPNSILIGALVAVVALLLVMLMVEKSKRKKAQTRASWLSAQALKAAAEAEEEPTDKIPEYESAPVKRETPSMSAPTAKEASNNPAPTPKAAEAPTTSKPVAEKRQAPAPITDAKPKYERRLMVEETPAKSNSATEKAKHTVPITNGKVYSDDKLFINELDADETDVIIVPEKQKVKAPKRAKKQLLDNRNDKLMLNLVVEESYEPLIAPKASVSTDEGEASENSETPLSENEVPNTENESVNAPESEDIEPEKIAKDEAPVCDEPKAEAETKDAPNPLADIANAVGEVSDAFATLVDLLGEKPQKPEEPKKDEGKNTNTANKKPEPQDKAPTPLEALNEKAKLYADKEDMFDKPPYKRAFNIVPDSSAFADSVTVPTALTVNMKEPVYINVGEESAEDEKLVRAEREGDVDLNIFVKSDDGKTEPCGEASKQDVYDVVDVVKPSYEAFDVVSSATARDAYTVEEAKRETMLIEADEQAKAAAVFDETEAAF